ncbi:uncharacterized protein THITE_2113486 [Thermothielavioides terrestris NRRL 8126]|uniref:Uncharacterized protein n=2 Tax=Thermothielavioides terrestris TaxID=2587410 RepID=G2R2Y0_THETT|nr:uncharacterized protein THITE_2113486 [Thermothielavioides terrestris NRRL 8126]AEO65896.1 hypothetical protein THITE_2113486 [Thermothielavioides terrestris NRRL 8126]
MPASFIVGHPATQGGATSSQEEYDETESEEDRVLTSSTEAIHPSASLARQRSAERAVLDTDSDESDGDENATALGRPSNAPVFRPQPNAFSNPPSHLTHRHSTGSAPYSHHPSHAARPHARSHRGHPNYMSPSYQADNDAALRTSLTTLLSCAAAARGLPKQDEKRNAPGAGAGVVPSSQPMELRLVPESELMADVPPPASGPSSGVPPKAPQTAKTTTTSRTASNSSAPSAPSSNSGREQPDQEKTKRAATTQSKPTRATKKKRTTIPPTTLLGGGAAAEPASPETDTAFPFFMISPTLLTWVVSAGVVVLVSVVGFGAGYVIGREVGRQEGGAATAANAWGGGAAAANASSGCGSEVLRAGASSSTAASAAAAAGAVAGGTGTLRRIRWGGVGKSVTA